MISSRLGQSSTYLFHRPHHCNHSVHRTSNRMVYNDLRCIEIRSPNTSAELNAFIPLFIETLISWSAKGRLFFALFQEEIFFLAHEDYGFSFGKCAIKRKTFNILYICRKKLYSHICWKQFLAEDIPLWCSHLVSMRPQKTATGERYYRPTCADFFFF